MKILYHAIGATVADAVVGVTELGTIVPVDPVVVVGTVVIGEVVVGVVVVLVVVGVVVVLVVGVVNVGETVVVPDTVLVVKVEAETGATVLGVTVVVVEAIGPVGTEAGSVVLTGATDPAVIVVVGATEVDIVGFDAVGELTAVTPLIVAEETLVDGARVVFTFDGGGTAATAIGAETVGEVDDGAA